MIIRTRAYPRAGLIGNPSDGYFGKTISFVFGNFQAEVVLYETPELEILQASRDHSHFGSIHALVEDVRLFGYYGGIRLLKATVKRFHDYCAERHIVLDDRNFTIVYNSSIPTRVGLAGSSAIITACLRALMLFYGISIPKPLQANLILSVETQELGISAGLQDRVAQVYEGLVYMDFEKSTMEKQGYGQYEQLDPGALPPLYIAYRTDLAEGSEVFHNDIRGRFVRGDPEVLAAMRFWAELAERASDCIRNGSCKKKLGELLNANFDMRRKIYNISGENLAMVHTARSTGASAKFCGSGGAIVGAYEDDAMYRELVSALRRINVQVIKPILMLPEKSSRDS